MDLSSALPILWRKVLGLVCRLKSIHCWDPARPLQESPGPFGSGISLRKSLSGPSGPGVQKVSKTVSGVSKETVLKLRRLFG